MYSNTLSKSTGNIPVVAHNYEDVLLGSFRACRNSCMHSFTDYCNVFMTSLWNIQLRVANDSVESTIRFRTSWLELMESVVNDLEDRDTEEMEFIERNC